MDNQYKLPELTLTFEFLCLYCCYIYYINWTPNMQHFLHFSTLMSQSHENYLYNRRYGKKFAFSFAWFFFPFVGFIYHKMWAEFISYFMLFIFLSGILKGMGVPEDAFAMIALGVVNFFTAFCAFYLYTLHNERKFLKFHYDPELCIKAIKPMHPVLAIISTPILVALVLVGYGVLDLGITLLLEQINLLLS